MNVHLKSIPKRSDFYGLFQFAKLDIVVVIETWFENGTSKKLMGNLLGNSFQWFGKEREEQFSSRGSGGIGIIVRKNVGVASLVKMYDSFEGMWIKLVSGNEVFYICGLCAPPSASLVSPDFA